MSGGQPPRRPGSPPPEAQGEVSPADPNVRGGQQNGRQQGGPTVRDMGRAAHQQATAPVGPAGGPGPVAGRAGGGHRGPLGPPSGGMWEPPGSPRVPPPGISTFSGPGRFQTQVFYQPAPAVEGDFCDHNPRSSVNAGPGGLVAGPPGVMVGRFAWFDPDTPLDPNDAPKVVISYTEDPQPVVGFVHREQQGLITHFLGGASMWVPEGFMITLHQTGGFFVRNAGDDRALLGMKAYASMADGSIMFADAGTAIPDFVESKWFATSQGDPNMLVKMSSWPLG